MGTPSRYSLEVPLRSLYLIDALWDQVQKTCFPGEEARGPLTTTFLLGLATPIITLPIERVERHRGREEIAYLNERPLGKGVAAEIDRVLVKGKLGAAPFYELGHWRFASLPYHGQNLAMQFPAEFRDALIQEDAIDAASQMEATLWTSCIRNALAHGGVLYLDSDGWHQHGERAEALAFISARYPKYPIEEHPKGTPLFGMRDATKPPEELRLLQISEEGFLSFLHSWVRWLDNSGLMRGEGA